MEFRLNGKEAAVVMGVTVMNAVIACKALNKAHMAEKEAKHQKFMRAMYESDNCVKDIMIKRLMKENEKLKSVCKEKGL